MIQEWLKHITTSAPEYVKGLGYLKEAIAIDSRYRRCKAGWLKHIENTKSTISTAIQGCKEKKKVVVIGSGLMIDLPLPELSASFQDVVLVDIVHMPSMQDVIKLFPNVRLETADVTGIAEKIFYTRPKPDTNLPSPNVNLLHCDDANLVISLNILSQLPIVPTYFLTDKCKWDENSVILQNWQNEIITTHYNALISLHCSLCLISDWIMFYKDRHHNILKTHITASVLESVKPYAQWDWLIAPIGTESRKYFIELTVKAILKNF